VIVTHFEKVLLGFCIRWLFLGKHLSRHFRRSKLFG